MILQQFEVAMLSEKAQLLINWRICAIFTLNRQMKLCNHTEKNCVKKEKM